MLKIVIVGAAGRMGRMLIDQVAQADDLELVGAIEYAGSSLLGADSGVIAGTGANNVLISADLAAVLPGADAVIDFSTGDVVGAARLAAEYKVSSVIGTTALKAEEREELRQLTIENGAKIVFAPNMSVGVNLLFHLVGEVARILDDSYDIEVVEMHHNQKKDAPSGTAVRLAEILCEARSLDYDEALRHGRDGLVGARGKKEIGMHAVRGGDVVGDHTVIFAAEGERVELTHKASSRMTFARGALRAARFLATAAPGMYDMQQVLGLK